MKTTALRRHLKTWVLFLLVLGSLVLSDLLVHGEFENPTETGLPEMSNSIPASVLPTLTQVLQPTRILFTSARPMGISVALPGTSEYNSALATLESAQVSNIHSIHKLPSIFHGSQAFEFPTLPESRLLSKWLDPQLISTLSNVDAVTVYLIDSKSQGVQIAMQIGNTVLTGQTDVDVAQFQAVVQRTVATAPWSSLAAITESSYVPDTTMTLPIETWQTADADLLPLVHSFFVNPQILTRIRENPTTLLWTDGSLAVQWNQTTDTLIYQDPSTPTTDSSQQPDDETAINFVHNHGGGPSSSYLTMIQAFPQIYTNEYQLMSYRHGLPIFSPSLTYTITVEQNLVVNFTRPLWSLVRLTASKKESILPAKQLRTVLLRRQSANALASDQITLGYLLTKLKPGKVQIKPVYQVRTATGKYFTIDASTGVPVPGGDIG